MESKKFDCVEMKRRGAESVYKKIEGGKGDATLLDKRDNPTSETRFCAASKKLLAIFKSMQEID